MAVCDGLEHIFDKPLPENPMFLEPISPWKHVKSKKTVDHRHSFTEIFGQQCLKENHVIDSLESSASSSPCPPSSLSSSLTSTSVLYDDANPPSSVVDNPKSDENGAREKTQHTRNDSISSMNSEISTCTEELGFESSDDVEDLLKNDDCYYDGQSQEGRTRIFTRTGYANYWCKSKGSRKSIGSFPPPISCIGRNGKPLVSFKSFKQDGRFILKEVRSPTQEFLHACRENGRLRMQFIQSDDEFLDEDEENVEENYEDTSEDEDGRCTVRR